MYLGVVPATLDSIGCHRFGGSGALLDWMMPILRLPDEDRVPAGHVREGHGDLHIEYIYFVDESRDVTILDCVETLQACLAT